MRWQLSIGVSLLLASCSFSGVPGLGGGDGDAEIDAGDPDAEDACLPRCSGDDLLTCPDLEPVACPLGCSDAPLACIPIAPSNDADSHSIDTGMVEPWVIDSNVVINTDDGAVVGLGLGQRLAGPGVVDGIGYEQVGGYAVFVVESLTINTGVEVEAVGTLPLIIRSSGDVEVRGRINVSAGLYDCGLAEQRSCPGPGGGNGADTAQVATGCADGGDGNEGTGQTGESGGGGGGARDGGGDGGDGNNGSNGGSGGTPDTPECVDEAIVPLTGGSGGGRGGDEGTNAAAGGGGGGAVQISSNTEIRVIGVVGAPAGVHAGGEGGNEGASSDGGGGGGAGGSILLEAPLIRFEEATFAANGGGGGSGDGGAAGGAGTFDDVVAPGGSGGGSTAGGAGGTSVAPIDGTDGNDGGGGGGAGGRVRVNVLTTPTVVGALIISPLETTGTVGP